MTTEKQALNYDPADPDKMRLPAGVTCGNCHHIRRCKAMFGHTESDTYCDWSPPDLSLKNPKGRQPNEHH